MTGNLVNRFVDICLGDQEDILLTCWRTMMQKISWYNNFNDN